MYRGAEAKMSDTDVSVLAEEISDTSIDWSRSLKYKLRAFRG